MRSYESVNAKFLPENLRLLWTADNGSNVKSVGAGMVKETSEDGASDVACRLRVRTSKDVEERLASDVTADTPVAPVTKIGVFCVAIALNCQLKVRRREVFEVSLYCVQNSRIENATRYITLGACCLPSPAMTVRNVDVIRTHRWDIRSLLDQRLPITGK